MCEEKEIVQNSIRQLKESVELFYQQKNTEALQEFGTVLGDVLPAVDILFSYKKEHEKFPLDESKIQEVLAEAMNALEEKDYILLADILQYDFIEYIEGLLIEME